MKIDHRNQVWSTDITYTAVSGRRAFVIGIVDSRKVMAYNVVNTMDAFHRVETLRMAIERYGKPENKDPHQTKFEMWVLFLTFAVFEIRAQ